MNIHAVSEMDVTHGSAQRVDCLVICEVLRGAANCRGLPTHPH